MTKKIFRDSLFCALATLGYISLVATFMMQAEKIVGEAKSMLGPITFLTLFVASAAITGSLVIGKPLLMYLDGRKMEAIKQFALTIAWMFAFLMIFLIVLAMK